MTKLNSAFIGAMVLTAIAAQAQQIPSDTTAGWSVDRYAPSSFISTTVGGQTALQSTISSADAQSGTFDATQGMTTGLNPSGALGNWSLSGNLYVTSAMLNGTAGPLSTELWAGTGPVSAGGFYIAGLLSGSTARNSSGVFDGSPVAGSELEIWNDNTGDWTYLSDSLLTANAWNSFSIVSDGVGTVNYFVDGVSVFSQTGMGGVDGDPTINDLSTVYLEDYNFYGQGDFSDTTGSYSAAWNGITGTVPDGGTTLTLLGSSLAGLAFLRRRFGRC